MIYFDFLFDHFPEEETYSWRISNAFRNILTQSENDDLVKNRQLKWLTHIIVDNAQSERISIVFEIVCESDEDIYRHAIRTFLDNNSDYEMFKKISLMPKHLSFVGSIVPEIQKQIGFLESLYTYVSGVKYLKHKALIKEKVEWLKEMIKREEADALFRNLYM